MVNRPRNLTGVLGSDTPIVTHLAAWSSSISTPCAPTPSSPWTRCGSIQCDVVAAPMGVCGGGSESVVVVADS